jgi:hypothetical protein
MPHNKHESSSDPAQEELFTVDVEYRGYGQPDVYTYGHPDNTVTAADEAHTAQSEAVDDEEPFAVKDARLRLQALEELREASMLTGLVKGAETDEAARIKATMKHPEGMIRGAKFKSGMDIMRAKKKLLAAFNLTQAEPVDERSEVFGVEWADFSQRYGIGANPDETARKAKLRSQEIRRLTGVIETYAQEQASRDET